MNPTKRKKLARLELMKQAKQPQVENKVVTPVKEEKVIQKEEVLVKQPEIILPEPLLAEVVQESVKVAEQQESSLELGLKVTEQTSTSESRKEKKKKWSSQEP